MRRPVLLAAALSLAMALCGCATQALVTPLSAGEQARLSTLLPADVLLLGEQHDAPEHQGLQRQLVEWLAARRQLAALALEMAERGRDTTALPREASEAEVRRALDWDAAGWAWPTYGPVVMAAVRAGVPVLGANLPRAQMREAMRHDALDARLPAPALVEQRQRIRDGHCGMLPDAQVAPMTRVQIARDIAMAEVAAAARQPGRTVLLVAGNGHVHRALGVPLHLPPEIQSKVLSPLTATAPTATISIANEMGADLVWPTPPRQPRDYCVEFRRATTTSAPTQ